MRRKKEKAGRYVRLFHVIKRSLFSVFKIKAAFFVIHNRMTDQDADNGGDRNGDHQSEEAEQNPAGVSIRKIINLMPRQEALTKKEL